MLLPQWNLLRLFVEMVGNVAQTTYLSRLIRALKQATAKTCSKIARWTGAFAI